MFFFKGYQDITPCIINITMPVYLVNGGVKQEISDAHFDLHIVEINQWRRSGFNKCVVKWLWKLSRKEMVIGENRTMDIAIPSPTIQHISRSIIWKSWSINGFAIDAEKYWKEHPTCQDVRNLKSARKYAQEAIFEYTKLNVMSQEIFMASTNTMSWKLTCKFIWKIKRIEKQHRWRTFTSLDKVDVKRNDWDKGKR